MSLKSISLYYCEGSSDKVYNASIEEKVGGYVVDFEYGRRGSTLNVGCKTENPVSLEQATKIFNKLVAEKQAKGYTQKEGGTPYVQTSKEDRVSGLHPQLLNPIDEEDLEKYLTDPQFVLQEKKDGVRMMIRRSGNTVEAINRKGLLVGFPQPIEEAVKSVTGPVGAPDFVLDGEMVGEHYFVFDVVNTKMTYIGRRSDAATLVVRIDSPFVHLVPTAIGEKAKRIALEVFKSNKAEGVVFKDVNSTYKAGRPASGGPMVKFKFYKTASFVVIGRSKDKRSVELGLYIGKTAIIQPVGKVTIPPNFNVPREDAIVEVRYLYAYEGGCIYQNTYLGERDDLEKSDCKLSQLVYKQQQEDDDA